jgi:hypothetical protein
MLTLLAETGSSSVEIDAFDIAAMSRICGNFQPRLQASVYKVDSNFGL